MTLAGKIRPLPLPLPPNNYPDGTDVRNAYDECLRLEGYLNWALLCAELRRSISENIMTDMSPPVAGRVLGYAL